MGKEELALEGERYKGKFVANKSNKQYWAGSEYTEHLEDRYWWHGQGLIEDVQTGEKRRFLFRTLSTTINNRNLEDSLLLIRSKRLSYEIKPRFTNKRVVLDLLFQQIYEDARENEEEIIPTVCSEVLYYEDLIEKGLVSEVPSGQMRLPLNA